MLMYRPWKYIWVSWVEPTRIVEALAEALPAMIQTGSAWRSDMARHMGGRETAAYKRLQWLVASWPLEKWLDLPARGVCRREG